MYEYIDTCHETQVFDLWLKEKGGVKYSSKIFCRMGDNYW